MAGRYRIEIERDAPAYSNADHEGAHILPEASVNSFHHEPYIGEHGLFFVPLPGRPRFQAPVAPCRSEWLVAA